MKTFFKILLVFLFVVGFGIAGVYFFGMPSFDFLTSSKSDLVADEYELKPLVLITQAASQIELEVGVADTFEERKKGLQSIYQLKSKQGMWFVFPDEAVLTFWMKDTFIPLDILFVNADLKIVSMVQNVPPCLDQDPEQLNCEKYSSVLSAQYALEVKGGSVEKWGVEIGDVVEFQIAKSE